MDRARLHHLSLGVVGVSLVLNGLLTLQTAAGSVVAGTAVIAGGACVAAMSAYSLLTSAETAASERTTYLVVLGAVLSVAGTALTLVG